MGHPDLRIVSMRTFETRPSQCAEWHAHPFHELCLLADMPSTIGKAGRRMGAAADTLFHFRPGEQHCFWNDRGQAPQFWVLHFGVGRAARERFSFLDGASRKARARSLSPAQTTAFKTYFFRIFREHAEPGLLQAEAQAGWLQLLLVQMQRWAVNPKSTISVNGPPPPELMRLWQTVNECVNRPTNLARRLEREVANYDSLRHAFKKTFGCSPHDLLRKLRLQHAKNLLLETSLSIKEIAGQLGYGRQHEFTRMFGRQTGLSPRRWRQNSGT